MAITYNYYRDFSDLVCIHNAHPRQHSHLPSAEGFLREWVKCVTRTRTRVRVTNWENICSSKIYALKALNCLNKRLNSSNKPRKYTN